MATDGRVMGPGDMLEIWGARSHRRLTDPLTPKRGGAVGPDDEEAAMYYVEATVGIEIARPVLRHVHILGRWVGNDEAPTVARCSLSQATERGSVELASIERSLRTENPLRSYTFRQPGETLPQALRRLGWWQCSLLRESDIPISVYEGFVGMLALRLKETPFVPPTHVYSQMDEGPATPAEIELFALLREFQEGRLGEVGYSDLLFIRDALLRGELSASIMERYEQRRRNRKRGSRSTDRVKEEEAQVQKKGRRAAIAVGTTSKRQ